MVVLPKTNKNLSGLGIAEQCLYIIDVAATCFRSQVPATNTSCRRQTPGWDEVGEGGNGRRGVGLKIAGQLAAKNNLFSWAMYNEQRLH